MAEAVRSPMLDRRLEPESADAIEVAGITIPRVGNATIEIDGRELALTSLDRSLYADARFTKADSIAYHLAVAALLLEALQGRALTVGRFPGGVDGRGFAQTESPVGRRGCARCRSRSRRDPTSSAGSLARDDR